VKVPTPLSEHQRVLDSIRRLVEALRLSTRDSERDLGISGAQLFVLQKLSPQKGLSLNELAERTFTHQSSVSVVVTRLEEKGLVDRRRSESDGRRVEIRLTRKGRSLLARAPSPVQDRLLAGLDRLSPTERSQLAALLQRLNTEAGIEGEAPTLFFEGGET